MRQSHTLNVSKITKSVETLSQSHNLNISPLSKSVETVSPDQQVPDAAGDVKGSGFAEQGHHLQEKIKRKLKRYFRSALSSTQSFLILHGSRKKTHPINHVEVWPETSSCKVPATTEVDVWQKVF